MQWMVLILRLPAQPSRRRVAVWRELRKVGALSLGQGVWAVPDVPVFADGVQRALGVAERAQGESVVLRAAGRGPQDAARFEAMFTAAREEDWAEFTADCGKYTAELDKEIGKGKLTLAELEEEEQSLERLRRWHRDLKARDVFGAPGAQEADRQLAECARRFEDYSERVFARLHPGWLWAARLGQGAAASAFSPAASALVARLNPQAEHGRAFGSYGFFKSIGYTAGPLLGGVLVWAGGLTLLFAVLMLLAAAVAVWAALAVPAVPPPPKSRQTLLGLARRLTDGAFLRRWPPWPPPPPPCPSARGSCPCPVQPTACRRSPPGPPSRPWQRARPSFSRGPGARWTRGG